MLNLRIPRFLPHQCSHICICKPVIKKTSDWVPPNACLFFSPLKCLKVVFVSSPQILCKQRKCASPLLAFLHLWVQHHFIFLPSLCFKNRHQQRHFNESRWCGGKHIFEFHLIKAILWHGGTVYLCACQVACTREAKPASQISSVVFANPPFGAR